MGHVGTARFLTLPQLKGIVFVRSLNGKEGGGASGKEGPSDIVCRRRLMRLCEVKPAYLRRLQYRNREGAWVAVYATEPLGHSVARQMLQEEPDAPLCVLRIGYPAVGRIGRALLPPLR